jgi:hypothetical protein
VTICGTQRNVFMPAALTTVLAIDRRLLRDRRFQFNGFPAIGVVITSEWTTDAIGVELAAEWLMLRADRSRLMSTRIKGMV